MSLSQFITTFNHPSNVRRALNYLINEQCTIPFVARYRQSEIGHAHAEDLTKWYNEYQTFIELQKKIQNAIATLEKRNDSSLTSKLRQTFLSCQNVQQLDDLWLPFKKTTSTRAQKGIDAGLGPIATAIFSGQSTDQWLNVQEQRIIQSKQSTINNKQTFQSGINDILAQLYSQHTEVRIWLRRYVWSNGSMNAKIKTVSKKPTSSSSSSTSSSSSKTSVSSTSTSTYDNFSCPLRHLRPHQTLALERGAKEKSLTVTIKLRPMGPATTKTTKTPTERLHFYIAQRMRDAANLSFHSNDNHSKRRINHLLNDSAMDAWTRLLRPSLNKGTRVKLLETAKTHAMSCFGDNVKSLLLQPPLPSCNVLGVDPGFRAGCKLAAIDHLGNVLETCTIYPHPPQKSIRESQNILLRMISKYTIGTISIGNGTASRETETLISALVGQYNQHNTGSTNTSKVKYIIVNEAGASVYSTSKNATAEFGRDTNPLFIGAVSIARRLQDPLSELVKIPPRSMGVGMYQHDMNEKKLDLHLKMVVQGVVSDIGVLVNQASIDVLRYVSGLNKTTSTNIYNHVRQVGLITSRHELNQIKGIGAKIYQQCAGFLRIPQSIETLDDTNVHPESYEIARAILLLVKSNTDQLIQIDTKQKETLAKKYSVPPSRITEIIAFLSQPGALSDPRRHIPPAAMREGPMKLSDIQIGTTLNGTIRNLTSFGAFVDIGVGTDGLLHASQLNRSNTNVTMGAGMTLKVVVLEVDLERKRIGLGMEGSVVRGGGGGGSGGSGNKRKRNDARTIRGRGGIGRGKGGSKRGRGGSKRGRGGGNNSSSRNYSSGNTSSRGRGGIGSGTSNKERSNGGGNSTKYSSGNTNSRGRGRGGIESRRSNRGRSNRGGRGGRGGNSDWR